jgi:hypothetical protein
MGIDLLDCVLYIIYRLFIIKVKYILSDFSFFFSFFQVSFHTCHNSGEKSEVCVVWWMWPWLVTGHWMSRINWFIFILLGFHMGFSTSGCFWMHNSGSIHLIWIKIGKTDIGKALFFYYFFFFLLVSLILNFVVLAVTRIIFPNW